MGNFGLHGYASVFSDPGAGAPSRAIDSGSIPDFPMEIADLKNRTVAELQGYAEALNIPNAGRLRKQDLIFMIYRGLAEQDQVPQSEGVLDILPDGYGFLRSASWNYLNGPDDVYVSPAQIASLGLRRGDTVAGPVRAPGRRERYVALVSVDTVNGRGPAAAKERPKYDDLRPFYPQRRLSLEVPGGEMDMRIMDLIAPVGLGQRGLIVSPPKAGKTTILRNMANAIRTNHRDVELVVLLIDERRKRSRRWRRPPAPASSHPRSTSPRAAIGRSPKWSWSERNDWSNRGATS